MPCFQSGQRGTPSVRRQHALIGGFHGANTCSVTVAPEHWHSFDAPFEDSLQASELLLPHQVVLVPRAGSQTPVVRSLRDAQLTDRCRHA